MRAFIVFFFLFIATISYPLEATHDGYAHPEERAKDLFPTELDRSPREDSPLRVDQAFRLSGAQLDAQTFLLRWEIADNYYLYQKQFAVRAEGADETAIFLELSDNDRDHTDIFLGEGRVYYQYADARLKLTAPYQDLIITYQGCWEGGICYPVQHRRLISGSPLTFEVVSVEETSAAQLATDFSNYGYYMQQMREAAPIWVLLLFFLGGIGLTFTPCVLPMLPILNGIITNAKEGKANRKISLALVYTLSLILVFSLMGLLSGWIGYGLRQAISSPVVLIALATLVCLLGASLIRPIRLPGSSAITQKVNSVLNATSGTYAGAALWGALSPLVVGTCLSAPLAAALLYLAERGSPIFGALTLSFLALGMSIPLLLIVFGGGYLLPRSGPWLNKIRILFALLLFGLAVFLLSSLLPIEVEIALYSFLVLVALGIWVLPLVTNLVAACALALLLGVGYGFLPKTAPATNFVQINDYATFTATLQKARQQGTPTLIYYSAEWCVSCRELERNVFNNRELAQTLNQLTLIRADVTHNNADSRKLMEHFDVLGPPSVFFIDRQGAYREEMTLVGYFPQKNLKTILGNLL